MKKNYTVLAIDTSCDETSVAITVDDRVMSNVIFSQVSIHKKWGGVVPMLAKRAHEERIDRIFAEALIRAKVTTDSIDAIAVTYGPGLAPALEVGIRKAKQIAVEFKKPLIAVNHMEGHLLSAFARNSQGKGSKISHPEFISGSKNKRRLKPVSIEQGGHVQYNESAFPLLGLLISGGHTQLVLMNYFGDYKLIGETLDDAVGEAYDKVAKIPDLGYPGGPIIEQLAKKGDEIRFDLPVPMRGRKDTNFSYSGLKTAVRYLVADLKIGNRLDRQTFCDIAASFQRVATLSLIDRLNRSVNIYKPKGLLLGGGVISNLYVRDHIRSALKKQHIPVYIPYSKKLFTDNAAMIGVCAYYQAQREDFVRNIDALDRKPNANFI